MKYIYHVKKIDVKIIVFTQYIYSYYYGTLYQIHASIGLKKKSF